MTGYSTGLKTSYDYTTIKYNAFGLQQWVARYDGSGNSDDRATALAVDTTGNVYVTGYSQDSSTSYDYATIKYNAFGVRQWITRYDGQGNSYDYAIALAVNAAKNVYVTGYSDSKNGIIYTTIKYRQASAVNTNSATNVGSRFATLNGTVNPNELRTTVKFQYGITANYGGEVLVSPDPIIGINPVPVSVKVTGLIPNTLYHFRIVATNNVEIFYGEDQTFTTLSCGPLTMEHTPISLQDAGKSVTATAKIFSACGVDSVVLKYRRGGDKSFSTAIGSVDSLYRWTIPASVVTSRGVEYFITAADTFNAVPTRAPRAGVFSVQVIVPAGEQKANAQPSGTEQNAYRLISMPLDLDNKNAKAVLEDNLGPYNKKKWRLFSLRPDPSDSQPYGEYSDTLKMDPGKAFLLIVKDPGKFIDTGGGKSNPAHQSFKIRLRPGWNFFGNPFNFSIPLENLNVKSGKNFALRYHEGTWRDPLIRKVDKIHPFEGYAIFNTLEIADTLLINPDLSSSTNSLAKEVASTMKEKILWSIRILAQCQEARDEDNLAAIVSGASSKWDELDQPEPPVIGEYVSVYFPHPKWGKLAKIYCTDVRPMTSDNGHRTSDGELWPFEVKTNISDKVNLTFEGVDQVPKELEVWLVDDALKITQNLRENNHYAVAGSEQPKPLKLVVGKHDFVGEKLAEAQAIPTTYELSQNFPNPFNPATTIRYGLPQAGRVTLKIYNLLGEEVALIINDELQAAGYHAAIWDGRNHAGKVVASGVYIYRLEAGPEFVKGFVQTRKMILLR